MKEVQEANKGREKMMLGFTFPLFLGIVCVCIMHVQF